MSGPTENPEGDPESEVRSLVHKPRLRTLQKRTIYLPQLKKKAPGLLRLCALVMSTRDKASCIDRVLHFILVSTSSGWMITSYGPIHGMGLRVYIMSVGKDVVNFVGC